MERVGANEKNGEALVKIVFDLEPDAWHGHGTESMWAMPIAPHRYRLRNVPVYALGVSYDDTVVADERDGQLAFCGVVEHGGHSTYRIVVAAGKEGRAFDAVWSLLETLGCTYERATERLLAIDVPAEADIYKVYACLEKGERLQVWDFEEGHCGHAVKGR